MWRSRNEDLFKSRDEILLFERNCHERILFLKRDCLTFPSSEEGKRWWLDDLIEESSTPDEQRETNNLQPFERFPTESQAHKPDE